MYKTKCKDCDCVYIGQTSRTLKTRVKEHAKAIATLDENSLLAKHHMLHSHQINLANVEIIDRSSAWRQRLILEAWHSVRDANAINEHIALPNVYCQRASRAKTLGWRGGREQCHVKDVVCMQKNSRSTFEKCKCKCKCVEET